MGLLRGVRLRLHHPRRGESDSDDALGNRNLAGFGGVASAFRISAARRGHSRKRHRAAPSCGRMPLDMVDMSIHSFEPTELIIIIIIKTRHEGRGCAVCASPGQRRRSPWQGLRGGTKSGSQQEQGQSGPTSDR